MIRQGLKTLWRLEFQILFGSGVVQEDDANQLVLAEVQRLNRAQDAKWPTMTTSNSLPRWASTRKLAGGCALLVLAARMNFQYALKRRQDP